jgi:hypothetical protein
LVLERALVLFGSNAEHDAGGFASWFADLCVSQAASEFADEVRDSGSLLSGGGGVDEIRDSNPINE